MRGTVGGVSDADSGSRLVSERLVLASASPRRQQLFSLLNVPFVTATADVDEEIGEGESPQEMVRRLSLAKARAVALSYPEGLIVAADTTVVVDGDVLGKPADEAEAIAMLRRLRGRKHTVFSGVTVYRPPPLSLPSTGPPFHPPPLGPPFIPPTGPPFHPPHWGGKRGGITELAESAVWMRAYTDEQVARYVASGDPLDKAGGYAIQHQNFSPVERIEGCYASVMGLPLCHLVRALAQLGLTLPVDVPQVCQGFTGHRCLVAGEILGR
ncbi:MAG: Maf-like protein [Chloroflexi bacterium]|nr:Maf-like protein [Chloroflexota bacterium]